MYHPDHETAMRVVYEVLRQQQVWPVVQYVEAQLVRRGARDPAECLATAPARLLRVESPEDPACLVRLTLRGLAAIDRSAPELFGFVGVTRRFVDLYAVAALRSASRAQPVVASASDEFLSPFTQEVTRAELMSVGLLLEVEGLAQIERMTDDDAFPWRGTVKPRVRRFSGAGSLNDCLDVLARLDGDD